jgi:hypothetical protein
MKCESVSEILALIKNHLDELSAHELRKLAEWIELYAQSRDKADDAESGGSGKRLGQRRGRD